MWDEKLATVEKEIWFGDKAESLIVEALKKLSDNKMLNESDGTLGLYERFVLGDEVLENKERVELAKGEKNEVL
jgi:hypothetical protein